MQTREYRTQDKSSWGPGPWQDEPDKVQWRDEATGLPCLAVRNHMGNWCGYVGVDQSHPWHGKGYDDPVGECTSECTVSEDYTSHYSHSISGIIDVHGGLTFADACQSQDESAYRQFIDRMEKRRPEAKQYPQGDAARLLREWSDAMQSHGAWKARVEATRICHLPDPGEPDHVWWFGFDCGHAGDLSPGMERYGRGQMPAPWNDSGYDEYRDLPYVKEQVAELARQLKAKAA